MSSFVDTFVSLFGEMLKIAGESGKLLYEGFFPPRTKTYNARFTPERKILQKKNKGWAIGTKSIPLTYQGFYVAAASGYGKTSFCVLPGIIRQLGTGTIFVLDSVGELYLKLSGYCKQQGIPTRVFNLSDRSGYYSDGWNPFPKDKSEVTSFCTLIATLALGSDPKDPFWLLSASACLSMLAHTLFALPAEYRTVGSLYDLLTWLAAKPKAIEKWMAKFADDATWIEFAAFMQNSANTRASIISSARSVLTLFQQENVRRITSHSTIDFSTIRETPQIVFLMTAGTELHHYKLLISLFFDQLIANIMKEIPAPHARPVHLMLEEAGIIKIPNLPFALTQCRKFFLNICTVVQSEKQWEHLYSREEKDTLLSNFNTKLFLSNSPLTTARELSELSGSFSYCDQDNHLKQAPLLTPQEVKEIPIGSGLLYHANLPPVFIKSITPYYEDPFMKKVTSLPPAPMERKLPEGPVPRLPIKKLLEND